MNRRIIAIVTVAIVLSAGAVLALHFIPMHGQKAEPSRAPYEFTPRTLKAGNITVGIGGRGFFSIKQNNTRVVSVGFYLNNEYINITSDVLSLAGSGTQATEAIGMPGVQLDIRYELDPNKLICAFTLNNTGNSPLPLDMIFSVNTYNLTDVTIFSGSPHSSTNLTLVPQTFGFIETYQIHNAPIYDSYWGNGTNINVDWYSMEGMLNDAAFTFTGTPFNSTEMTLEFSGVVEPAGFSLNVGQISMSF
ncbi:hypothetical protein [Thermoplasma acidophilum]|nr:hypothetical protein [Thermoplasma acidophilum]